MADTPTAGDDLLIATDPLGEFIYALEGDDTVVGGIGNDTILGGDGANNLFGGGGSDLIIGGADGDILDGGAGKDSVYGAGGEDVLFGGDDDDDLFGGAGDDILEGGDGNDILIGGAGADSYVYRTSDIGQDIIRDFVVGEDTIDLRSVTGLEYDDLLITQSGPDVIITAKDGELFTGSIVITGASVSDFTPDNVRTNSACFMRGTLIATPDGEALVESLTIGDLVSTLDGVARPVKWIGRRAFKRAFVGPRSEASPVCITKGALGSGLPHSDLYVSAKHAMFFDGAFVRAEDLVNDTTILRDRECETIEYFHVELDTSDVIFANGSATETFANHNSRRMFVNWQEYVDLYGGEDAMEPNADGEFDRSYPLVTEGEALKAIVARFAGPLADETPCRKAA
jgi:hypothetical protein